MSFKIHITNLSDSHKSIQVLLDSVRDTITQSNSAVIHIDLLFPQTYPITTNPEVLGYLIEELVGSGIEQIYVIGASYNNFSARKIWKALGFDVYISSRFKQVQFIAIDEEKHETSIHEVGTKQVNYPKIVEDAKLFISIVNPKVSLLTNLSLSVERSPYLLSYDDRLIHKENEEPDYCEKDGFLKKYKQIILDTHFIRPPDLVLYDFSSILSYSGPILYQDSKFQYSNLMMIAENSVIGDLVALQLCNKDTDENPMIDAIKEYDYGLVSHEELEKYKITLFTQEKDTVQEKDITSLFIKKDREEKPTLRFRKKKEAEKEELLPKISGIESFIDIFDVFPQKAEICKGVMCSGCKLAGIELLSLLKTAMSKDQETIPNFSILLGKNPIEPENEYCLVFGDHAINTTKKRKFKEKKITKTVKSDRDIELERAKLKIKLQKKEVELESHHDFINHEILEGPKRDRAKKRLTRKIAQTQQINEYRLRVYDKYSEHTHNRNKKLTGQEQVKVNTKVLEIPGCPPNPIAYLDEIVKLFKKRWVPGLLLQKKFLDQYLMDDRVEVIENPEPHDETEMKL